MSQVIGNPHNQTLNVAVQWGLAGVVVLYAMWLSHFLLFRGDDLASWIGSLVADAFRILVRGGIYIYPADGRKGFTSGRLRLLYEANPIAMITEQAGGACTTGTQRMMDIEPLSLHQRVPLIFGSKTEVEEVAHYYRNPHTPGDHSPLFSQRGLFRSMVG